METKILLSLAFSLFFIGFTGIIIRKNVLIMLMCMELMLNGLIVFLATYAHSHSSLDANIFTFIIYIVAAIEVSLAIPLVVLLVKEKKTLAICSYSDLKG